MRRGTYSMILPDDIFEIDCFPSVSMKNEHPGLSTGVFV